LAVVSLLAVASLLVLWNYYYRQDGSCMLPWLYLIVSN